MAEKVVRDAIHGNIMLDGVYLDLVDTRYFQRLRNIKQNGLCYLVYPSMNSTRFEHSLGVYHLAGVLSKHLELKDAETAELRAACLLHDIGHGPFSHTFDELMMEYGLGHEEESVRIILQTEVTDILKSSGIKPANVASLVLGEGWLGKLMSSEVDVDKMDYLVRDAYYAGVAYGVTDVERLLYSLRMEKGDVVVDEGGLEAAESLLINRNMMYQTVYRHHTKRIAESMIIHAVEKLVSSGVRAQDIFRMDDVDLIHLLRSSEGYVRDMYSRIDGRRLFKIAFSERLANIAEESRTELRKNAREIESKIAEDLGVEDGYLLLDYPETSMSEYRVKIKTSEGLKYISEVSQLAESLEGSEWGKLTVNVYTRPEDKNRLKNLKPEKYFNLVQKRISGYV